jgi:hypothetical protein
MKTGIVASKGYASLGGLADFRNRQSEPNFAKQNTITEKVENQSLLSVSSESEIPLEENTIEIEVRNEKKKSFQAREMNIDNKI